MVGNGRNRDKHRGGSRLMKKLILSILFILCLSFQASAWNPMVVVSGSGGLPACAKDSGTLVMDESAMSGDSSSSLDANARGQSISYASDFQLYSIYIDLHSDDSSSCVMTVRIGSDKNLTGGNVIEEWSSVATNDDYHEFVSTQNDTYSASTTYYIGFIEDSGTCKVVYDNTSPPYAGGTSIDASSVWQLGSDGAVDYHISVYKTTVTPCE